MTLSRKDRSIALVLVCAITIAVTWAWIVYDLPPHLHSAPKPAGVVKHESADHLQDLIGGALENAGVKPAPTAVAPKATTPPNKAVLMHDAPGVIGHDPRTMIYGYAGTGCTARNYFLLVYLDCALMIQPGTTRNLDIFFDKHIGEVHLAAASFMSGVCALLSFGWLLPICILTAAYYANEMKWYAKVARNNHQCLRIRGQYFPGVPEPRILIDNFGKWMEFPGLFHGVYPTPCMMPRANPCATIQVCL